MKRCPMHGQCIAMQGCTARMPARGDSSARPRAAACAFAWISCKQLHTIFPITHPSGVANRAAAATTDGAAAARRDREKRRTYGQLEPNGYPLIPFSIETYGRLGKPAISFLGQLGLSLEAKEAGRMVSKSGFVAAAIRELSVGLCRGNYQMYGASLGLLAGVSGRGFREGAAHPTEVW
jgi:hypothetical protein